ncbi:MAG: flagellar hook-length control protein FliK [Syntrophotaleaceae bacterium]
MAMIMEMPVVPPTRPNASPSTGAKPDQGKEAGFREVLNEENLKQAKGSAEKGPEEKDCIDNPSEDSEPAAEQVSEGSVAVSLSINPAIAETPAEKSPSAPGTVEKTAASVSGAVKPDSGSVMETGSQLPQLSGEQTGPEVGTETTLQASGENLKASEGRLETEKPAAAGSSAPAASQPAILRVGQEQNDLADMKTGPQGLMEATFAGLLKPVDSQGARKIPASASLPGTGTVQASGEEAESLLSSPRQMVTEEAEASLAEALSNQNAGSSVPETGEPLIEPGGKTPLFDHALASAAQGKPATIGNASPLPGGSQMPAVNPSPNEDVRVLDQILHQLPMHRMGEKSRVVIRLHPEELGEVKLDLVMDKDHLKAQLVTQSQQVQNILEKHLPRLQEALQNQGINLDQIEVSVDSGGRQGQEFFDRHNQPAHRIRSFGPHQTVSEPANVALFSSPSETGRGGLSLRI